MNGQKILQTLPLVLIGVLYILLVFLSFDMVEEGAYIYFRFAANIANGFGYVFNVAGLTVESGSSVIWQLLMVLVYWLDPHIIISTKFIGMLFGLLCIVMIYLLAQRFAEYKPLQYLPPLLLVCSVPFYTLSHMGLETPMFVFLVLFFVYALITAPRFAPILPVCYQFLQWL